MKKCINAWTVGDGYSFEETFAVAAKAGFDGIELNIDLPERSNHSLTMESTGEDYTMIRGLSEKYDLPVTAISSSLGHNLTGDYSRHDFARKLLFKQIEAAKALGAKGILSVPGGMPGELTLHQSRTTTVEFYKALRNDIEAEGILVGLENVANRFFMSPYDMVSLIDEIGSNCVGAYFDAGNVLRFSEAEWWIEILGSRTMFVHVKDFLRTSKWEGERALLTEGSGNWGKITAALQAIGYDGCLTAEVPAAHGFESDIAYYTDVAERIGKIIAMP